MVKNILSLITPFIQSRNKENNELRFFFNFRSYLMNKKKITEKETKYMYTCTTKDTDFK